MDKDHKHVLTSHVASFWRVKTGNVKVKGQNWSYIAQGDPKAQPIVFLHGLATSNSLWRSQMQSYDNDAYYRIALNIPGACFTQYFEDRKHTLHELCRWLDDVVDQLNLVTPHIVAHSTNTLVATFYAATRPEKVKSLTLLSIPDFWGTVGGLQSGDITKKMRSDVDHQTEEDSVRFFETLFYNPPSLPKILVKSGFIRHQKYIEKFLKVTEELETGLPLIMPQTRNVKCPLLIINGEVDPYSSRELIETLPRHYPKANTVNLRQCGHVIMLEKPIDVARIHMQFLAQGYSKKVSEFGDVIQSNTVFT